jgi:hypothetical protein
MAVAVSETAGSTVALDDTVATIARFAVPIDVIAIPRDAGAEHAGFSALARLL